MPLVEEHQVVVSLGSESCAADSSKEWIQRERSFLQHTHEVGVPIFGICFGAQLLADALGGKVLPNSASEVGWVEISSDEPSFAGPWFEWHFDTFVAPDGAEILARSGTIPEAFRLAGSVGVQFHPEVTQGLLRSWARTERSYLIDRGIDPEDVSDQTPPNDLIRRRAFRLFDEIVA